MIDSSILLLLDTDSVLNPYSIQILIYVVAVVRLHQLILTPGLKYVINGIREILRPNQKREKLIERTHKAQSSRFSFMFIVSITRSSEKRKRCKIMTEVLVDTSKSSESKEADLMLHAVYILGLTVQ